jgi:hypothetical protein
MSAEQEQLDVISRISESPSLAGLKYGANLLRYLYAHRDKKLSEKEIAIDFFKAKTEKQIAGGSARQHCMSLRGALQEYVEASANDDEWRFFLPEQVGQGGYQLKVLSLRSAGIVHAFWQAHLKPVRPIVIVWNEPPFYRNEAGTAIVRVPGSDGSPESVDRIRKALAILSGGTLEGEIYPSHLFAMSGEIGARDRIAEWFSREVGIRTGGAVSRHMKNADSFAEWSPILLGNVHNSEIMREVTEWYQFGRFGYFIDAKGFRVVEVRNATDDEREFLTMKYETEEVGDDILLRDDPTRDHVVFATVTRMPNHFSGENAITMLSASYTKVLEQMAYMLTDEQDLKKIFAQVGWSPENNVPRYFQWLFSIRLGRHHADNRPAKPKLRCFRHFERFAERPTGQVAKAQRLL